MRRRTLATLAGPALIAAGLSTANAATTPADPHPVSTAAASAYRDFTAPAIGDRQWLLYYSAHRRADRVDYATERMIALSRTGTTHVVKALGDGEPQAVGDLMTAAGEGSRADLIDIWNLAKNTSESVTAPSDGSYLGTSPDGFFYYSGTQEYDRSAAGQTTNLGSAFPGFDPSPGGRAESVIADQDYALFATDSGKLAVYSYATRSFRQIAVPHSLDAYYFSSCPSIVAAKALCDFDNQELLISLDTGRSMTFATPPGSFPVLGGDGANWIVGHRMRTVTFAGTRHTGPQRLTAFPGELVGALGSVVLPTHHEADIARTAGAGHRLQRVVSGAPSPIEAFAGFALGGSRIAWRDDSGPRGGTRLHIADIRHGRVRHARVIRRPSKSGALALSTSTLAYATTRHGKAGLDIEAPAHSRFVPGGAYDTTAVSGRRVVYASGQNSQEPHVRVYDTRTGRITTLPKSYATTPQNPVMAISGPLVAYEPIDSDLAVTNVKTGATTADIPANCEVGGAVYLSGHELGWQCGGENGYVDLATMSYTTDLPGSIVGLCRNGVVVGLGQSGPFDLVPYGAKKGPRILGSPAGAPLLAGTTIAWRNASNRLLATDSTGVA